MKLFQWIGEKKRLRAALELSAAQIARLEREKNAQTTRIEHLKDDIDRERAGSAHLLSELRKRAPRVVKVPERAMREEDVLDALNVDDGDAMWRAVHQLLDQAITDATDAASERPKPDPRSGAIAINAEVRTFHAGGVDHLREFQAVLLDLQAKARRNDAAAEAKEGEE